ncbi:MAG: aminopeptidase N [Rhizomicrobium sp.]
MSSEATPQIEGTVRLADYRAPDFHIDTVELTFDLDAARTIVENRMTLRRADTAAPEAPLVLDGGEAMELVGLRLDGRSLSGAAFLANGGQLVIPGVPDSFTLEIATAIAPAQNSTAKGLFELGGKLATQCEAEGFRDITYFLDRPDVLARYRVTLRADAAKYPVLLSNGNPESAGMLPDGRHWATWVDPWPKPSYIFGVFAGDFGLLEDSFVTRSGRPVKLGIYADHDLVSRCRFAMDVVKRSLAWDEETYGLEYDLDVYNIVALTGWAGAMENKGLNLFEAHGIVTDPDITTDGDYVIIERIIGHEQFHNWTGNRVTCRDWFQLCLKEGLTRFRDQQFIEDKMAAGVWRVEGVQALRRNQFTEDDGAAAHPVQPPAYAEIDNFYTNTVYDKGAELVRMLRAMLSPEVFRKGFDLYIARNDGKAVTIDEWLAAMEAASGRDLGQFRRWYTQAGRPRIAARGAYDAARRQYRLSLTQTCPPTAGQPDTLPFQIPVAVGLLSRDGAPLRFSLDGREAESAVLDFTQAEQTFVFDDVESEPVPSLLRGFSAPVTVDAGLSNDDLAILIAGDSDPFARWDAAQTLGVRLIRGLASDISAGKALQVPPSYLAAIGRVLTDSNGDKLLRSQILAIPDEPMVSEGLAQIDLDGQVAGRNFLRRAVAERFGDKLVDLYAELRESGPYAPDIAGISRRRLKNVVLDLLATLGGEPSAKLALAQLKSATNMTDMYEALCTLTHMDRPERDEGVAWFYERWKSNSTVVDKWFGAQALSRAPGAVDRIIALEEHPAFDFNNRARGMLYYGGFCRQNRVAFHDPSGKGYEFLADRLLMIDRMGRTGGHYIMPQINQWRRYDPHRQALMRKALERVAGTHGISKGLAENVTRALQ